MRSVFLGIIAVFVFLLGWILVERQLLLVRKKQIVLPTLPKAYCGLRLVQISDLHHRHMGKQNGRIVKKVRKLQPDVVVITGDLISRDMEDFTETALFLQNLRKICPVYLCPGNHELDLSPKTYAKLERSIAKTGCRLLQNETVRLDPSRSQTPLYLAGATLRFGVYRDANYKFQNLEKYTVEQLEQDIGIKKGITILLAHNPFFAEIYEAWGADLVLCGHVHGGIVRLPFVGGVLSPERRFFPKYDKGYYRKGATQLYVSGGIGKLRLFNPPEVTCLELERE